MGGGLGLGFLEEALLSMNELEQPVQVVPLPVKIIFYLIRF
jgi:hypothetical protein